MAQIEFHQVSKRFDNGQEALHEISAQFEEGSMTFLTGHSGAGKSTFLKLLLCLDRPTRGQILVNGINVTQLPSSRLAFYRQNLGAVFQDHHLLAHRSVFENVALPLRVAGFSERDIGRRVRAALSRVGLLSKEGLFPRYLSTGEQQRVGIARAVVNRPKILLADELPDYDRERMMADMDAWGYTFRLGSARDWFERDAEDARAWLLRHGLISPDDRPTFRVRTG